MGTITIQAETMWREWHTGCVELFALYTSAENTCTGATKLFPRHVHSPPHRQHGLYHGGARLMLIILLRMARPSTPSFPLSWWVYTGGYALWQLL